MAEWRPWISPANLSLRALVGRPLHEARAEVERKGLFLT